MGSTSPSKKHTYANGTTTKDHTTMAQRRRITTPGQHTIRTQHNMHITQYHKRQLEHKTHTNICKYLTNYTQTKDTKYIHPPLTITNLTLSIHECNPDKDIQVTNQPTKYNTRTRSQHIRPKGKLHGHPYHSKDYNGYGTNSPTITFNTYTNFLQPPPQNFETEILWLIQRYITILPKKKPKIIQPNNLHQTLPPDNHQNTNRILPNYTLILFIPPHLPHPTHPI